VLAIAPVLDGHYQSGTGECWSIQSPGAIQAALTHSSWALSVGSTQTNIADVCLGLTIALPKVHTRFWWARSRVT